MNYCTASVVPVVVKTIGELLMVACSKGDPFPVTLIDLQMPRAVNVAPVGDEVEMVAFRVVSASSLQIMNVDVVPLLYRAIQTPRESRLTDIGVLEAKILPTSFIAHAVGFAE